MDRTIQLRRYRIRAGELDAFTAWFADRLVPAREAHGFHVEFAYAVPETEEFVWAVSTEGDADAFSAVDARYSASQERAAAFEGVPQRVASSEAAFATPIA